MDQKVITFDQTGRLLTSICLYPLENAKVLIQLGHEPLPPYPTKTIFGTPVMGYPNIFKYVRHIYRTDGLLGCYRGFFPWISTSVLYSYTLDRTKELFPPLPKEDQDEDELTDDERLTLFSGRLVRGVVCRSVAVVITQPLHVLTVRTIAQFVGHETTYTGVLSGLWTILKEEGIYGLFCGLLPRLLGEIFAFIMCSSAVYLIHQYWIRDKETQRYVQPLAHYITSAQFYSFNVVGSCMAVTDSGLAAGSPPRMPHYSHMFDCWSHLQSLNQLSRGSKVLWRYYTPVSPQLLSAKRF